MVSGDKFDAAGEFGTCVEEEGGGVMIMKFLCVS